MAIIDREGACGTPLGRRQLGLAISGLVSDRAGTRLVSRNRIATPKTSGPTRIFYKYVMEPGSLVMERKMLLGIKERAENRLAKSLDTAELHETVPTRFQSQQATGAQRWTTP